MKAGELLSRIREVETSFWAQGLGGLEPDPDAARVLWMQDGNGGFSAHC